MQERFKGFRHIHDLYHIAQCDHVRFHAAAFAAPDKDVQNHGNRSCNQNQDQHIHHIDAQLSFFHMRLTPFRCRYRLYLYKNALIMRVFAPKSLLIWF